MNDYESDLYIDHTSLDIEWLEQPNLVKKYTSLQAKAKKEVDRLNEKLAVCRAQLDRKIRANPEKFNLSKVTEPLITSTIIIQKKYRQIQAELIEAKYEKEMVVGSVISVEHKKTSLENLSRLVAINYFAGPRTPRDLPKEISKRQEQDRSDGIVAGNIKRKKRKNKIKK
jgi:hypothetical protein